MSITKALLTHASSEAQMQGNHVPFHYKGCRMQWDMLFLHLSRSKVWQSRSIFFAKFPQSLSHSRESLRLSRLSRRWGLPVLGSNFHDFHDFHDFQVLIGLGLGLGLG